MIKFNGKEPVDLCMNGNRALRAYMGANEVWCKKYTVTWVNDATLAVLDSQAVKYGGTAVYQGSAPARPDDLEGNEVYSYSFAGWSADTDNVTEDITVYTKWTKSLALRQYTFPNAQCKMTSDYCLGIHTFFDGRNGNDQSAYAAFDNNTATAYVGTYTSTQNTGCITIVFPFPIKIQSVTIKNASVNPNGASLNIGGLKTGRIYISPNVESGNFSGTVYASLDRGNASAASYATTHTNPNYNSTDIRSICIWGTSWGSDGAQKWHVIGEVSIVFRADPNLADAYGIK